MTEAPTREQGPFGILVAQRVEGELKPLGSGAVIAPGLVLTAWHVASGRKDLVVRRGPDGTPIPVQEVLPREQPAHDLALLRVQDATLPVADGWSPRPIGLSEVFEAWGYASVLREDPSTLLEQVKGTTNRAGTGDSTLNLDIDNASPPVWSGMSGAAARVDGKIVAVVRAAREDWAGKDAGTKRITATPLAVAWHEKWFRAALVDRDAAARDREQRLQRVRTMIVRMLGHEEELLEELAHQFNTSSKPEAVAEALLTASGHRAAVTLSNAVHGLREAGSRIKDPPRFRRNWTALMPLMADLERLVVQVRATMLAGTNRFEFSWREESLAEVVLAGAELRGCELVEIPHRKGALWGVGFRALPPALDHGVARFTQKNVAEAVTRDLESLEDRLQEELGEPTRELLDQSLRTRAELSGVPTLSLVVVDGELGELADHVWRVTTAALGQRLPHLRLVRLKGGRAPSSVEEGGLHAALKALLEGDIPT